jgi:hypothetical protein
MSLFFCVARVSPVTTLEFLLALGLFGPDVRALVRWRWDWEALEPVHVCAEPPYKRRSYSKYLTLHLWSRVAWT